jgi:glycerol-3-phosphate dehydrogenase
MERIESGKVFDIFIIGGGITGANILWDATLRGLEAILVDKNDFASGTTQATSKMIHGGLRYLKNLEFGLVRESLRERRILAKISPHGMRPLGYLLPVYSIKNKLVLKIGLKLYDLLSWDRNFAITSDLKLPVHEFLSFERTVTEDPNIPRENLKGAFLYYDYANVNPERHCTEFIFSAKNKGGYAYNYSQVNSVIRKNGIFIVEVKDRVNGKIYNIQTKTLINASGPWADYMEAILGIGESKPMLRSKGIHIIIRNLTGRHTYIIQTKRKTHLFVIPWRGLTIIGTTDAEFKYHPDDFKVTKTDIKELITEANEYCNFQISMQDIRNFYGGLRPLVSDENSSTYNASRKTEITHHKESGVPGFFTAMGGKYTTSRQVAESLVDLVCDYLPGKWKDSQTKITPLDGGNFSNLTNLLIDLRKDFPRESEEKLYLLAKRYGTKTSDILRTRSTINFGTFEMGFHTDEKYYPEEVTYIFQKEDVKYLSDFYLRRSGIGTAGIPPEDTREKVGEIYKKISKKPLNIIRIETKDWLSRYEIKD